MSVITEPVSSDSTCTGTYKDGRACVDPVCRTRGYFGPFCGTHRRCTGVVKRRVVVGYNRKKSICKIKEQRCSNMECGGTGLCGRHGGLSHYNTLARKCCGKEFIQKVREANDKPKKTSKDKSS